MDEIRNLTLLMILIIFILVCVLSTVVVLYIRMNNVFDDIYKKLKSKSKCKEIPTEEEKTYWIKGYSEHLYFCSNCYNPEIDLRLSSYCPCCGKRMEVL